MAMKVEFLLCIIICQTIDWISTTNATECDDHKVKCDFYWSRGWFTCNNGAALWRFCPRSCGLCGDKDCVDKRMQCDVLKRRGYCAARQNKWIEAYMKRKCQRTCGFCVYKKEKPKLIGGCRDYEPRCSKWARYGECEKSSDTRMFCPKSCGVCGKRYSSVCKDKKPAICKTKHICMTKHREATKSCKLSCHMCRPNSQCADTLSYCYKMKRFCKPRSKYFRYMSKYCPYSCGRC